MQDVPTTEHQLIQQEQAHVSNREALLGSELARRRQRQRKNHNNTTSDGPQHANNSTASEAAAIQQSLNHTQALLQNELQRVSHVASAIDQDGKMLNETMNEHQTMIVSKAQKALTSLQRAQQREQRYLMASIIFFWAVVLYIFWCRVILHLPLIDTLIGSIRQILVGTRFA